MVDNSRVVDLSGEDLVINTVRYSTAQGSQGFAVLDNTGGGPTIVAGTTATLTEPILETGLIITTNAAAVTLTTDTAANIITAMNNTSSGAQIGDVIIFTISCHGAGGITLNLGTGITNPNGAANTLTQGVQRTYVMTVTSLSTPALVLNA